MDEPKEIKPSGFNLQVTYRDDKTGQVTHTDPYTLRVSGEQGSNERVRLWERPKGSGNLFDKKGNPAGRWVYEKVSEKGKTFMKGKHDPTAEHIEFTPPLTQDQLLAKELTDSKVKIAELEREMASIKAEREKKDAPASKTKKD